jgi:hypothetical protein
VVVFREGAVGWEWHRRGFGVGRLGIVVCALTKGKSRMKSDLTFVAYQALKRDLPVFRISRSLQILRHASCVAESSNNNAFGEGSLVKMQHCSRIEPGRRIGSDSVSRVANPKIPNRDHISTIG